MLKIEGKGIVAVVVISPLPPGPSSSYEEKWLARHRHHQSTRHEGRIRDTSSSATKTTNDEVYKAIDEIRDIGQ